MANKPHTYTVHITWTGNHGTSTSSARAYSCAHLIEAPGKPAIEGSSDTAFRGDPARWNPEELLLASLAACHKLWYLGLCAESGLIVTEYEDHAEAVMEEQPDGAGQFVSATLRPQVTLAPGSNTALANALHQKAHAMCFIARSVNFPVLCAPQATA